MKECEGVIVAVDLIERAVFHSVISEPGLFRAAILHSLTWKAVARICTKVGWDLYVFRISCQPFVRFCVGSVIL